MHFHKYPYPANFEFPVIKPNGFFRTQKGSYEMHATGNGTDIYHIQITGAGWEENDSTAQLQFPKKEKNLEGIQTRLVLGKDGSVVLQKKDGTMLLATAPKRFFGQCGEASLFEFIRQRDDQFYGLGEKWNGFEHSEKRTKFWNADVWADFHPERFANVNPAPDPVYLSIPYLIVKRGNTYLGLLMDNPHATFISTKKNTAIASQMEIGGSSSTILLGAEQGQPNLYIIFGPTLAELTQKLQKLIGVTPLPPAWALGYHQCRWGYESEADLKELDTKFRALGIPADGLWLDIEYLDRYKVFTFEKKNFKDPKAAMARFAKADRKVVPIIDPGVKLEAGYGVYERGKLADAFCKNPQGKEYVGLVWPGETVFPDFSLESTRAWWAREVAEFARLGIYGAWLDMNDPSTGPVENQDMLFQHGAKNHSSYHNQYALGMAAASREGFLKAHPDDRPFLLSRSGFTGSNRYTAIWTGDNSSNYRHLKNSIATTLNLALSGIPFNGPDAGGFGGDATPKLMEDWFKAGFLFPIFRNHTIIGSRRQEPWAFGKKTLAVLRRYIQLRYRLRPYLYQLFAQQEREGEAILRPLFYDFQDTKKLPLGLVDDQFMVGPGIMQAPFVMEKQTTREVVLPGKRKWYDVSADRWIAGGQKVTVKAQAVETPIYVLDGSILPLARLVPNDHRFDGAQVDFRIFLAGNSTASTQYVFDDGATFAYQKGERSEVEVIAKRTGKKLAIIVKAISDGYGHGDFTFTAGSEITQVEINGLPAKRCAAQGVPLGCGKTVTWC